MNTILITGTAKTIPVNTSKICVSFKVQYNVNIWASVEGEQIQFITSIDELLCGHGDLWGIAKHKAANYFNNPELTDGGYSQYLEHLTII